MVTSTNVRVYRFEEGDRVEFVVSELRGRRGTVTRTSLRYVWVELDGGAAVVNVYPSWLAPAKR
jgi:hypothetical protein